MLMATVASSSGVVLQLRILSLMQQCLCCQLCHPWLHREGCFVYCIACMIGDRLTSHKLGGTRALLTAGPISWREFVQLQMTEDCSASIMMLLDETTVPAGVETVAAAVVSETMQ